MLLSIKLLPVMASLFMLASGISEIKLDMNDYDTKLSGVLQQLEAHILNLAKKIDRLTVVDDKIEPQPMDCEDVWKQRQEVTIESGLYLLWVPGLPSKRIYCNFAEQETWTTISRRIHKEDIFNRTWDEYKNGFGKASGDYWIGNEMLYQLTDTNNYDLRITMVSGLGGKQISSYKSFRVEDEGSEYRLLLGAYDSANSNGGDSFFPTADCNKNGNKSASFSTYDFGNAKHCSQTLSGGWWFTDCGCSNLNGKYMHDGNLPTSGPNIGLYWDSLSVDRWGLKKPMHTVELEIRRI